MAKKEIEFLKEKARKFYLNEKDLFKKGDYDLCAFNLERSCQEQTLNEKLNSNK
jgi:HEPN domain-containing protein